VCIKKNAGVKGLVKGIIPSIPLMTLTHPDRYPYRIHVAFGAKEEPLLAFEAREGVRASIPSGALAFGDRTSIPTGFSTSDYIKI
jgi:hypothetical protein